MCLLPLRSNRGSVLELCFILMELVINITISRDCIALLLITTRTLSPCLALRLKKSRQIPIHETRLRNITNAHRARWDNGNANALSHQPNLPTPMVDTADDDAQCVVKCSFYLSMCYLFITYISTGIHSSSTPSLWFCSRTLKKMLRLCHCFNMQVLLLITFALCQFE